MLDTAVTHRYLCSQNTGSPFKELCFMKQLLSCFSCQSVGPGGVWEWVLGGINNGADGHLSASQSKKRQNLQDQQREIENIVEQITPKPVFFLHKRTTMEYFCHIDK